MAKSEGKKQSRKKTEGKQKAPPLSKGAESSGFLKRTADNKKGKRSRSSSRIKGSSNPKMPTTATPSKRKQNHRHEDSDSDFQMPVHVRRQKRTPREEPPISPDAPPSKAPSTVEKKDKMVQFRCKTRPIMDLNGKIVHHPRRNTIRHGLIDANFHGLLEMQVELINKELTQLLISPYEPDARRFVFPDGEVSLLRPQTWLVHNNIKLAVLKTRIEECMDGNALYRMYILHSLGTLLVPGNSWKITLNYAKYLNEELSKLGSLNWGQYVAKGVGCFPCG
ncbi:hypothetical protein LINPERHAP1_LOCUS8657 [Linum perenne]